MNQETKFHVVDEVRNDKRVYVIRSLEVLDSSKGDYWCEVEDFPSLEVADKWLMIHGTKAGLHDWKTKLASIQGHKEAWINALMLQ